MAKIITSKPEVLWNLKCILGEGTLWVKEHNSIFKNKNKINALIVSFSLVAMIIGSFIQPKLMGNTLNICCTLGQL